MTGVNFKLYQQMVDKGIIEKYQKKTHDGKIDNDAENTNLNDAVETNFDANNDGEINEQDIEAMKEAYNQMVDYLVDVNKNAANIKIVNINVDDTKEITSRTKMFFDETGDLKWYQDGYSYYGDNKEKGYTQHLLNDGTKKVVDNFEYNEFGQAIKWDENIFADEATTEFIKSKQEITWADDELNAATRLVQNIDKATGEITEIAAYKLNDDNSKAPVEKTSDKQVFNVETLKNTFFNAWTIDTNLKNNSSNFTYKVNFGDLTANLSGFKTDAAVYNIFNEESVVHTTSDNGKNINIYDTTGILQNTVVNNLTESYPALEANKIFLSSTETIILANGENALIDDDNTVKITTSDGKLSSMSKTNGNTSVTLDYDEICNSLSYATKYYTNLHSDVTVITDRLLKDVVMTNFAKEIALTVNSDINSEEYINSYNSTIKNELVKTESNMKNVVGEIIEKNDGLYVNNGDGLVKLSISAETYLELFPPVLRYDVNQQSIGDCYFVSACLLDMMKSSIAFADLIQMFSEEQNGDISVTFNGALKGYSPVTFKNGDLQVVDGYADAYYYGKEDWVNGSKGIQMLEQAYAISRFSKDSDENVDSIDVDETIDSLTSGHQTQVYNDILGLELYFIKKDNSTVRDCKELKILPSHGISWNYSEDLGINITTYFDQIAEEVNSGTNLYSMINFCSQNSNYDMHTGHAYSIEKIDTARKLVYIINPWYGGVSIEVPYNVFQNMNTFSMSVGHMSA